MKSDIVKNDISVIRREYNPRVIHARCVPNVFSEKYDWFKRKLRFIPKARDLTFVVVVIGHVISERGRGRKRERGRNKSVGGLIGFQVSRFTHFLSVISRISRVARAQPGSRAHRALNARDGHVTSERITKVVGCIF